MTRISPKIEIINHFDNLINKVDIDIDHCLENCNDKSMLGEMLESFATTDRKTFRNEEYFNVEFHNNPSKNNLCTESTKVIDYLNQVRMETIEELRKAQNDCLEYYKTNLSHFKSLLTDTNSINEFKSELFAEQFYFQVKLAQPKKPSLNFTIFTFVTDFYMSQFDVDSLE